MPVFKCVDSGSNGNSWSILVCRTVYLPHPLRCTGLYFFFGGLPNCLNLGAAREVTSAFSCLHFFLGAAAIS